MLTRGRIETEEEGWCISSMPVDGVHLVHFKEEEASVR